MSYVNFKNYRQTVEQLDSFSNKPKRSEQKNGIMSFSKGGLSKNSQKIMDDGKDKELRTVLEYVKLIEGMNSGS